jgi:phage tail sheath protein FI
LTNVQVPPSVVVLGAMALNDAVAHPWFAPAGFARGSLATVVESAVKLNQSNLDTLHDADINPIVSFPGTGPVIWGQKTLLAAQSALDRVNVRRLLIEIRRQVRDIAQRMVFEPNRESTLSKFEGLVRPRLQRIQELNGVDRFKVKIDTTTTTQADVENNTIRGKIYVQPTKTIEFVSLDFVVTNTGASI